MTNKINGIDVSECEYINCCSKKAKCIILQDDILSDSQYCESEADCYFKQLKRLQEENEGLKSLNDFNVQKIEVLQEENEELKKQLEFSRTHKTVLDAERIKYKQALENIKTYINQECKNKQCPQTCANCFIGNILNKVNEVLNDRD